MPVSTRWDKDPLPFGELSGGSWSAHARTQFHSQEEARLTPEQNAPPLHARGRWPWLSCWPSFLRSRSHPVETF